MPSRKRSTSTRQNLLFRHPTAAFGLLSLAIVLLLYAPSFSSPFVYDDLDGIVHNPNLATLHDVVHRFVFAPVSFTNEFRATTGSTWRPLFWLSLALDRRLFGLNPAAFHTTNLLLHWLNGLLLLTVLRRVLILRNNPATHAGSSSYRAMAVPALAALLWLILPINSEAVAWISGRAYPLCLLFLLLGVHAALTYRRTGHPAALATAFFAGLVACLANESGLLFIPIVLLLSAHSVESAAEPKATSRYLRTGLLLTALLGANALFLAIRHLVHATTSSGDRGGPHLWSVGASFCHYLAWAVVPLHMSIERSTSTPSNTPSSAALLGIVALLAYVAAVLLLRRTLPIATAGLAFFAVAILPVCGVVPLYQGMAERFLYIPSIGVALALTALAMHNAHKASVVALALFVLFSMARLYTRVSDWTDPATLYASSLAATPSSPSLYVNLAFTAREHGDLDTAREDYQRAIELQPRYERAYASLGDVEARLHHPAQAVAAFEQALILNPNDAPTRTSLALSLQALGNAPAAEQEFHRSLSIAPNDPTTYTDLAVFLAQQNRLDEAIQTFQHAIALNPTDATPYFDLGVVFQQRGQDDVALPFYRKVLSLKPDDPDTLVNISRLHTQR